MRGQHPEWTGWQTPGLAGALFQHVSDPLFLVDPLSECILDANQRAVRLTELEPTDLIGAPLRSLVRHEQEWQDWLLPSQDGAILQDGFQLRTGRVGRWLPVSLALTRMPLPDSDPLLVITLHDRREHLEHFHRLQRTEADLRRILATISECLWTARVEADGRFRYHFLSPVVQRLTGRSASVFLEDARAWQALVEPGDLPTWSGFRENLLAGNSGTLEYRLRRADGTRVWVRESVSAARDEAGLLLQGILTDVSDRKNAQDHHLDHARARQLRLDGIATFAGNLAHDFNNLITGVLGHVSLARLGSTGPETLDQIEAITFRAADLCRQLATVAGKTRTGGQIYDPATTLRQLIAAQVAHLPGRPRFRLDLPDERPGAGRLPSLAIDEAQFRLVVEALLRNAAEALGRVPGEIGVTLIERPAPLEREETACFVYRTPGLPETGSLWCLEVQDDGPGIPADVHARLCEPFRGPREGGRGLGLALVLGLVRSHHGALHIHSRPGEGTRVRVFLPAVSAPLASSSLRPVQAILDDTWRGEGTVLLADDEQTVLDVASRLLYSVGCEVIVAHDGEEAVRCFRQHPEAIRLALVDLTMPKLCGEKTLRELRKLAPDLPLVLMSGYPESDVAHRFADIRLAGYLQKPFRLPALLALLRQILPAATLV